MKLKFMFALLFITAINAENNQNVPRLEISNGWLQGVYEKSYNGRIFSAFEGIPYARPPVGELRFEAPKEPYNWTGTWIANTKHTCIQTVGSTITGHEDCLYINVYVPRERPISTDNLNVIVHIHGGGFTIWSAHYYSGPKYLMDEEVIFVTMNYRLGPFGFLSTQDEIAPGNNGMKDQALSLKWIQNNIKYFGGNPDSITITGMSAGGASVHLHYFSPLSKGLFHQGMSQSGNALDPWAIQYSPLKNAISLAELIGCPTDTTRQLLGCLKSRSATEISEALKLSDSDMFSVLPFGPVIENKHDGAYLTEDPYKMLLDGTVTDVPWVVSVTEREGVFSAIFISEIFSTMNENLDTSLPQFLFYNDDEAQKYITEKIKERYFQNNDKDITDIFIDVNSDRLTLAGADTAAKLQAKANKSPVYFYKFGYRGQHSLLDILVPNSEHTDATHGDDILYYLHCSVAEEKLSDSDEKMKAVFTAWLLNFAETQEPKLEGIKWNPVSGSDVLEFLYFKNPDNFFMEAVKDFGDSNFWNKLPFKENKLRKQIRDEL